jgi:hypothetical protein
VVQKLGPVKTVDLTQDGHAVPVVDELATIPLNLWATEHVYLKLQNNFLGKSQKAKCAHHVASRKRRREPYSFCRAWFALGAV